MRSPREWIQIQKNVLGGTPPLRSWGEQEEAVKESEKSNLSSLVSTHNPAFCYFYSNRNTRRQHIHMEGQEANENSFQVGQDPTDVAEYRAVLRGEHPGVTQRPLLVLPSIQRCKTVQLRGLCPLPPRPRWGFCHQRGLVKNTKNPVSSTSYSFSNKWHKQRINTQWLSLKAGMCMSSPRQYNNKHSSYLKKGGTPRYTSFLFSHH